MLNYNTTYFLFEGDFFLFEGDFFLFPHDFGDAHRLRFAPPLIDADLRFLFFASTIAADVTLFAIASERLTASSFRTCCESSDIYLIIKI